MNASDCPVISVYPWLYEKEDDAFILRLPSNLKPLLIHHWKCFPVPVQDFFDVIGGLFLIIGILAFLCNVAVIYICVKRKLRNVTDVLTLNLFITDLLMVLTEVPILVTNCFKGTWVINYAASCEFHAFCGGLFGSVSIVTITVIAIDRYFAIVPPYNVYKFNKRKSIHWLVFIWSYSILINLPPFFGWNYYVLEGGLVSCSFNYLSRKLSDRSYIMTMFVLVYVIPLSIILFCYVTIMITIWRFRKQLAEIYLLKDLGSTEGEQKKCSTLKSNNIKNEYRIFKIFLHGVVLWFIAWTPYACVALVGYFGNDNSRSFLTPVITIVPAVFAKLSACYNPLLYALKNPTIKFELVMKYKKWKKKICVDKSVEISMIDNLNMNMNQNIRIDSEKDSI